MWLSSIEISNYRSIENVKLDGLGQFNVLIGRNNSGKSAVIGALSYLSNVMNGKNSEATRHLRKRELNRSIQIKLEFFLTELERSEFLSLIFGNSPDVKDRVDFLINSDFWRNVRCTFETPEQRPDFLRLVEVNVSTEDQKRAVVYQLRDIGNVGNPEVKLTDFRNVIESRDPFVPESIEISSGRVATVRVTMPNMMVELVKGTLSEVGNPNTWLIRHILEYFKKSFFFSPFRHSNERLAYEETINFDQDGSNLPLRLHTIYIDLQKKKWTNRTVSNKETGVS